MLTCPYFFCSILVVVTVLSPSSAFIPFSCSKCSFLPEMEKVLRREGRELICEIVFSWSFKLLDHQTYYRLRVSISVLCGLKTVEATHVASCLSTFQWCPPPPPPPPEHSLFIQGYIYVLTQLLCELFEIV